MTVTVLFMDEDCSEGCCMCGQRTGHWYPARDVALCTSCAEKPETTFETVPKKGDWFNKNAAPVFGRPTELCKDGWEPVRLIKLRPPVPVSKEDIETVREQTGASAELSKRVLQHFHGPVTVDGQEMLLAVRVLKDPSKEEAEFLTELREA